MSPTGEVSILTAFSRANMISMKNMKRRDQILLLSVIGVLLVLFVISTGWFLLKNSSNTSTPPPSSSIPESGDVMLSFKPNIISAKIGQTVTSDVIYDAGTNPTSNLIIKVTYDPKVITNVQITPYKDPTSAISYSFEKNMSMSSYQNGTVTLALNLVKGAVAQKGRGIVAKLSATVVSSPATISFSPEVSASSPSNPNLTVGRINLDITK